MGGSQNSVEVELGPRTHVVGASVDGDDYTHLAVWFGPGQGGKKTACEKPVKRFLLPPVGVKTETITCPTCIPRINPKVKA